MLSPPITEFDVQALVDSYLSREEERQVWRSIRSDPDLEAYYRRIVSQKKLLIAWWQSDLAEKEPDISLH